MVYVTSTYLLSGRQSEPARFFAVSRKAAASFTGVGWLPNAGGCPQLLAIGSGSATNYAISTRVRAYGASYMDISRATASPYHAEYPGTGERFLPA